MGVLLLRVFKKKRNTLELTSTTFLVAVLVSLRPLFLPAPRLGPTGTRADRPDSSAGQQASWKHGPRYHGGRWGIFPFSQFYSSVTQPVWPTTVFQHAMSIRVTVCLHATVLFRRGEREKKKEEKKKRKEKRGEEWSTVANRLVPFLSPARPIYNAVKGEKTRVKRLSSYTLCEDKFSIARSLGIGPNRFDFSLRANCYRLAHPSSLSSKNSHRKRDLFFSLSSLFPPFPIHPILDPRKKKRRNEAASRDDCRDVETRVFVCRTNFAKHSLHVPIR